MVLSKECIWERSSQKQVSRRLAPFYIQVWMRNDRNAGEGAFRRREFLAPKTLPQQNWSISLVTSPSKILLLRFFLEQNLSFPFPVSSLTYFHLKHPAFHSLLGKHDLSLRSCSGLAFFPNHCLLVSLRHFYFSSVLNRILTCCISWLTFNFKLATLFFAYHFKVRCMIF